MPSSSFFIFLLKLLNSEFTNFLIISAFFGKNVFCHSSYHFFPFFIFKLEIKILGLVECIHLFNIFIDKFFQLFSYWRQLILIHLINFYFVWINCIQINFEKIIIFLAFRLLLIFFISNFNSFSCSFLFFLISAIFTFFTFFSIIFVASFIFSLLIVFFFLLFTLLITLHHTALIF